MCLFDTTDGALMCALYLQPGVNYLAQNPNSDLEHSVSPHAQQSPAASSGSDPIAFLYYSIVLTTLTVIVAIVIGIIQLLTMIDNVAKPSGSFWDGVQTAGDYYAVIGGSICGCFLIFGVCSVLVYRPWRSWMLARRRSRGGQSPSQDHQQGCPAGLHDGDSNRGQDYAENEKINLQPGVTEEFCSVTG